MRFRPFRNDDPPALAAIWNAQPPSRGLLTHVTAAILDELVFSKLYFDRTGCVIAEWNGRPVGFLHAACGPDARRQGLDWSQGVLSLMLIDPAAQTDDLAAGLLERAEEYLQRRGARSVTVGTSAANPFYVGLYGGSNLPGVLPAQETWLRNLRTAGYRESGQVRVFHRSLDTFRPVVDRHTIQWRRQYRVEVSEDPPLRDWWEAAVWGSSQCTQYALRGATPRPDDAMAMLWDMQPLATAWGLCARGLLELVPPAASAPEGLTAFFLAEILRLLKTQGVNLVEAQVSADRTPLEMTLRQLEFQEVDRGLVLTKTLTGGVTTDPC